mmetsp:Transcript_18942/g.48275  ORF Transcript_18942/g.48275 Transcript_18942/m.48275 type:complete len:309 (-) Transcript_18942:2145-3071(-)
MVTRCTRRGASVEMQQCSVTAVSMTISFLPSLFCCCSPHTTTCTPHFYRLSMLPTTTSMSDISAPARRPTFASSTSTLECVGDDANVRRVALLSLSPPSFLLSLPVLLPLFPPLVSLPPLSPPLLYARSAFAMRGDTIVPFKKRPAACTLKEGANTRPKYQYKNWRVSVAPNIIAGTAAVSRGKGGNGGSQSETPKMEEQRTRKQAKTEHVSIPFLFHLANTTIFPSSSPSSLLRTRPHNSLPEVERVRSSLTMDTISDTNTMLRIAFARSSLLLLICRGRSFASCMLDFVTFTPITTTNMPTTSESV